jgi:hypothetical protein
MDALPSFANDVRLLFKQVDIDHMQWFCDLANYDDVKAHAQEILNRLKGVGGPIMPPPPAKGGEGPWSADNIALFQKWIDGGYQP